MCDKMIIGNKKKPCSLAESLENNKKLISSKETQAYRVLSGSVDGYPGFWIDLWNKTILLSGKNKEIPLPFWNDLVVWAKSQGYASIYWKHLNLKNKNQSPTHRWGQKIVSSFDVREWDLTYQIRFNEGYSVGLFPDQRENRKMMQKKALLGTKKLDLRGKKVLNTFSYTCAFSLVAAQQGAMVTSLDLSRKYLEWGKINFTANGFPLDGHDFIYGDAFEWLRRLRNKGRRYDLIILDPPTFSHSKKIKIFRVEKDYQKLAIAAMELLNNQGWILASTNCAQYPKPFFKADLEKAARQVGSKITATHFVGQPNDYKVGKDSPAYLKTFWLQITKDFVC